LAKEGKLAFDETEGEVFVSLIWIWKDRPERKQEKGCSRFVEQPFCCLKTTTLK
jgi:hypothetical protein